LEALPYSTDLGGMGSGARLKLSAFLATLQIGCGEAYKSLSAVPMMS
jgi:hypothetical protein